MGFQRASLKQIATVIIGSQLIATAGQSTDTTTEATTHSNSKPAVTASQSTPQTKSVATDEARYIVVPDYNLKFMPKALSAKALEKKSEFVLVKLTDAQIHALAESIHENKITCGGFVDVDDEVRANNFKLSSFVKAVQDGQAKAKIRIRSAKIQFENETKSVIAKADRTRYETTLKGFTSLPDRFASAQTGVNAAEWLVTEAQKAAALAGKTIQIERVATNSKYIQPSIVVKIPGADSTLGSVVLGGHMDTYQNNKPGADDDASGSIAVLEVFKAVLDSKLELKRDLYFAFYAAEEWGLHGSKKVVEHFKLQKRPVHAVLQFDMVGYRSPNDTKKIFFTRDYTSDDLTQFTKDLAVKYLGLQVVDLGDIRCDYACSDHASWNTGGFPVVYPFEADFNNYNKKIHTGLDAMNLINIDHAMNFVRLGVAFAVESAEPVTASSPKISQSALTEKLDTESHVN